MKAQKVIRNDKTEPAFFSSKISAERRFFFDQKRKKAKLFVISGGYELCTPDYCINRTSFPFFGIELVAAGKGTLTINNRKFPLSAGTLFSYGPGIRHRITTDASDRLSKYFIDFSGTTACSAMKSSGLQPGSVLQTSAPSELIAIFDSMIGNGTKNTSFSHEICSVILQELFLKIRESSIQYGSTYKKSFVTYQKCRDYLSQNYLQISSLEAAAKTCHIDKTYMCRLFAMYDKNSPYERLLRLKMQHGARMLEACEVQIKELSNQLGFTDQFHFSRTFKKVFGISPSKFAVLRRQ